MSHKNKFICIHGHFYQPPRENAWLEVIELQDSASPFHNWNERINFECYAPNTAARILDHDGYITGIINNYTRISFNFGPTLLSWMEKADPETYRSILTADRISMERNNGHGSAIAQVYSHLIMPLANHRDKETQVLWGIHDFEYRFGRRPEGIWLAETAVDTETLEILAQHGILFTILAPRQAKAFRKIGDPHWIETPHDSIDPRRPYVCSLPSGKTITLFFYHGGIAQGVAFNGLLNNGKHFAQQFLQAFDQNDTPQLAHIATDGESYGHHHRRGEMALADCLNHIEENGLAQIINYGDYLERFKPEFEVMIHENSSWSCVHGIERWRSNCGCNSGGFQGWTQQWRHTLRDTLNWLRDELIPIYEREGAQFFREVWAARNDYIQVILTRNEETKDAFMQKHVKRPISKEERIKLFRLLEMQRNAILMFTSCGWFFDEISGIETNQILQYANRAIYYAHQVAQIDLHGEFIRRLEAAPSNVFENGAVSYQKHVAPARVDLVRVGMHYAASSLFEAYPEHLAFFNYLADSEVFHRYEAGILKLATGRTKVRSKITESEKHFSFAVLYLGQQNIIGNISLDMDRNVFDRMTEELHQSFQRSDLGEIIGRMQTYFGSEKYSIWHLFQDEKRKILRQITENNLKQIETAFRDIYNDNYQLMASIAQSDIPVPEAYLNAVEFVVNLDLQYFFENGNFYIRDLKHLAGELRKWNVGITREKESALQLVASERIFKEIKQIEADFVPTPYLQNLVQVLDTLDEISVRLDVWKSQNAYFSLLQKFRNNGKTLTDEQWKEAFLDLGTRLQVKTR